MLNRSNNRASLFHKDGDFDAFDDLLAEAKQRNPMRILAYCVLPNHFHRALWPLGDGDLGRWMHSMRSAERTVGYRPHGFSRMNRAKRSPENPTTLADKTTHDANRHLRHNLA